ncbi:MAG: hypothetical protein EXS31_18690 [Pedosphaera sp.]|nr:hypothetical protein [Pedosphaera sp.]
MAVIDAILNLVCVLLWLNWRSQKFPNPATLSGITLATALRSAGPPATRTWSSPGMLIAVLLIRAVAYHEIGSAVNWTATLQLGALSLPFRSDRFMRIILFSTLSFGVWLFGCYVWLMLLSVVNRGLPSNDPQQRLVRGLLGLAEWWPSAVKLLMPAMVAAFGWIFVNPLLYKMGLIPASVSEWQLICQALLLACATCLLWKYLLVGLFLIHLINSYLYLGNHPVWQYISHSANRLLKPFRILPLRLVKVDFAPVIAIPLVLAAAEALALWLPKLYQRL